MTKEELEGFVDKLNEFDINEFSIRYEGSNRVSTNNGTSGIIKFNDDGIYVLEVEDNYTRGNSRGPFSIRKMAYTDEIASIQTRGLSVDEALKLAESFGIKDEEVEQLISNTGDSVINVPGLSNFGMVKDSEGNPVLRGMAGRITKGVN